MTAFGGPAAHIAMMHDEVVRRRRWMDDQQFLDMVGATNLIPGPNSTELAMHVGQVRGGWRGLVVAGAGFILPAAAIVSALAWLYVRYGTTPAGEALLYGIKPVVIAIVVHALVRLGRTAMRTWSLAGVAAVAAAVYLLGVDELVVLAGGAVVLLVARCMPRQPGSALMAVGGVAGSGWGPVLAQAGVPSQVDLMALFGIFLEFGAVLYGSGYVLVAFLRGDLVERLGWLTDAQLLDAVAIGQLTPGPVFTTATFVGYLLAGLPGAVVATVGIFGPSFVFVAALGRLLAHLRDRAWTAALLDGVNLAALGLMAGVSLQLGVDAIVDPLTIALAAAGGIVLWRSALNASWLIAGGAAVGVVASLAGLGP